MTNQKTPERCDDDGCLHYDHPAESEDHAATVTGEAEFAPGECRGDEACPVALHWHGCYADGGNCDEPDEHPRPGSDREKLIGGEVTDAQS